MNIDRDNGEHQEPGINHPIFIQNRERLLTLGAEVLLADIETPRLRIKNLEIDPAISVAYGLTAYLDRGFGMYEEEDEITRGKIWGQATRAFFASSFPVFETTPAAETFRIEIEKEEDGTATIILEVVRGTTHEVVELANQTYIDALSSVDLKLPDIAALSSVDRANAEEEPIEDEEEVVALDEIETLEEYEARARQFLGDEEIESEEDVLERIAAEVRKRLRSFGIEKIGNKERVIDLLRAMDDEPSLLDDLAMLSIAHRRGVSRNSLAMPTFQTLEERSQTYSVNPQAIRTHIAETYAPFLQTVGYTLEDGKRLMRGSEDVNAAFRWLAILLSQDIMSGFPEVYKTEIAGKGSDKLQRSRLFSLARFEVKRQLDLHKSTRRETGANETCSSVHELKGGDEVIILRTTYKYDSRIEEDVEDYIKVEKALERTLATCDILFAVGR